VAAQTASPGQLVLMLYDGALGYLERAQAGFGFEDPAQCNQAISNNLLKAQEVIQELNGALNLKEGGDCAANLRRLYNYLDQRLQQSNLRKEPTGIQEVIRHLSVLRDAWRDMLEKGCVSADAPVSELSASPA
jgi:flagellar protein FliS